MGVIYWNTDGEIVDANDRFLEMTGYTREELEAGAIDWLAMTPLSSPALMSARCWNCRPTVNSAPFEKEYLRKDGTRVPIILAGAMLDEERYNGVAFVLDITRPSRPRRRCAKAKSASGCCTTPCSRASSTRTPTAPSSP